MRERRPDPAPLALRVALAGAGTVLASFGLLLLVLAASAVIGANYHGLENDTCSLPEELERTLLLVLTGAGAVTAAAATLALLARCVKGGGRPLLTAIAGAIVVAALGASLLYMLDPAVDNGVCSRSDLDRALWLFGVTGTSGGIATLLTGLRIARPSGGSTRQMMLRLTIAVVVSLSLWSCAWWMHSVLRSAD